MEIFIAAGWIEASSTDEITEQQVQQCVADRCKHQIEGENLYPVEHAVRGVTVDMQIADPVDRTWTFRRDYCNALRDADYGDLPSHLPHIAIGHILKKLKPHHLYTRMTNIVKWRKNENFEKENFNRFCSREFRGRLKNCKQSRS